MQTGDTGRRARKRRQRFIIFQAASVLFVLLLAEVGSRLLMWKLPGHDFRPTSEILADQSRAIQQLLDTNRQQAIEIHAKLGWRYAPNFKSPVHQLNSMALRSAREYSPKPPSHTLRIAAFGDSYVYGSEVDNPSAWAALIEADDSHVELLNYGVGGYGVDQAYLRYLLEGADLHPQIVMMGFTTDDIGRVVNRYRRFVDGHDLVLFKPRYLIDQKGDLTLLDAPVHDRQGYERVLANPQEIVRYAEHDYWYRASVYENPLYEYSGAVRLVSWLTTRAYRQQFDPERLYKGRVVSTTSSAFRLNVALLQRFAQAVQAAGASPIVVMLPDPESVRAARTGSPTRYQPLIDHLRNQQIVFLDGAEAFRKLPQRSDDQSWFAPEGHYSAAGNRIVASWLGPAIKEYAARLGVGTK